MTGSSRHLSDSAEQRSVETVIVAGVAQKLGVDLRPARITIGGASVDVDGVAEDRSVLVEAYARIGALKGGQPKKLATDALKLSWLARNLDHPKLVLAVCDETVEAYLNRPGAWLTAALHDFGIEVIRVDLDPELRELVINAQTRQYR